MRTNLLLIVLATGVLAFAAGLELDPDLSSPQAVGTTIVWTASSDDPQGWEYQFSVAELGKPFRVVKDFSPIPVLRWTRIDEGAYLVRVIARKEGSADRFAVRFFTLESRIEGPGPVISATSHPLVALYSIPPCPPGASVLVQWSLPDGPWQSSGTKRCTLGKSVNFYIGGMRESSTYRMRHVVLQGLQVMASFPREFTTGEIVPPLLPVLPLMDPAPETSFADGVLLHSPLETLPLYSMPFATDLAGNVIWYYGTFTFSDNVYPYATRPTPGGTMIVLSACCLVDNFLIEIDIAGNTLRQTSLLRVSRQLEELGYGPIDRIHHDVVPLPNGRLALLAAMLHDGNPSIMGDAIVVLDQDLQVEWVWRAIDHLSTARGPVLGEDCAAGYGAELCVPPYSPDSVDWLHSNSIAYVPEDGSLLVSMRHQDWVIKIDYGNSKGSGAVLWRLGKDGDFTTDSTDPYPWFSHQHDAYWIPPNKIAVYDNGNTRCVNAPAPCNSRGQVWEIDEANRTAKLVLNADLLRYSDRFGSAQPLSNGNFSFGSGFLSPELISVSTEVTTSGSIVNNTVYLGMTYRTFRLPSLYY